jgi:O-antigen/teichoic acid export membrane protein
MFCTLIPAGLYFFSRNQHTGPAVAWRLPWFMVVLAASLAFQIDSLFSFMEGCGYVPRVARTRLWQAMLGSSLAWAALLTHHGLFAPAMVITGQVFVGFGWLWTQRRLLFGLFRHNADQHCVHWRSEVWPFQWRIAVSWMCGYFIFQLFVPVLFVFRGPLEAGQMGMSLSISNMLTSVAISWVNTKAAPFGSMVARREYRRLDQIFFRALAQSLAVSAACSLMVWTGLVMLNAHHLKLASRMLAPLPFGILLLTVVVNHTMYSEATYLRSHKQEKLLPHWIFGAVTTGLSTYLLGKRFGAIGMLSGYFVLCVIGLGLATYTFLHYRRIWHADV